MRHLIILLFLIASSTVFANNSIDTLFEESFQTHYVSGRCGDNITNLLDRADISGIDISAANILEITNRGFTVFGMINVEYARASGRLNPEYPAQGLRNLPGERNWHHHIILEQDGFIYDYDFGNTPVISSVKDYFDRMFLNEKRKSEGGEFYVGEDEKLAKYKVVVRPALETLNARRNRNKYPESKEYSLQQYLLSR